MRFRILGPLEVWDNGRRVPLGGPQQRALLGVLLLDANRVVSTDRLVECLWGTQPPVTARGLLQGCVAQLRRALRVDGDGQPLVTRAPGYLMEVLPGELDVDRFEQLAQEAATSELEQASGLLSEALSLWRGPALSGCDLDVCRAETAGLDERRLAVWEDRIEIDLRLGRAGGLVAELQGLVGAHPLRERLWAQLMVALYGADRQADALAAYRRLRDSLVEQLGVEPGATLRGLHQAMLAGDDVVSTYLRPASNTSDPLSVANISAGLSPSPGSAVAGALAGLGASGQVSSRTERRAAHSGAAATVGPAQLPAATAAFTGRVRAVKQLDELLVDMGAGMAIGVISGTPGVGKTALALHWAHQVRERFCDGQLYVNLRGYSATPPMTPLEVLAGFLPALGLPAKAVPEDLDQAAGLYRSLLADKKMLVVLDNAESATQVRPLLPGSAGCVVVVTSRDRLGGLVARDGAVPVSLDVLDASEAQTLLVRLVGQERVQAEPRASAELTQLCARLPLALRIAAANLMFHVRRTIAEEVAELAAGDRLASLRVDGDDQTAVRTAFDASYSALAPEPRRLFRLLGLVPGSDVTPGSAAALAGASPTQVASWLAWLADAHLLDEPASGRYAFHDLLRLYAAERAHEEESLDVRMAASGRLLDWYLRSADAAARLLYPEKLRLPVPEPEAAESPTVAVFASHTDALAWLDAERPNLVAATRHAADNGSGRTAWLLANTLHGYFHLRMHTLDWLAVANAAMRAAEAQGNLHGLVTAHFSHGDRHERQGNYDQSRAHYTKALEFSREASWLEAQAVSLGSLGILHRRAGRLWEAADHYNEALALDRQTGWLPGQAARLGSLGNHYAEMGRLEQAAEFYGQALATIREIGSHSGEAIMLGNLGECCVILGRFDEAVIHFDQALVKNREVGHRGLEADNLRALATVHCDAGRYDDALELAQTAVKLTRQTGDRRYEADALNVLGSVYERLGKFERAAELHQHALRLARETGARQHEVAALVGLAHAFQHLGRSAQASTCAEQALILARQVGFRLLEGPALIALATVQLAQGAVEESVGHARLALAVSRDTGHRLGEARALLVLGTGLCRAGDVGPAVAAWNDALSLFSSIGSAEADKARALLEDAHQQTAP